MRNKYMKLTGPMNKYPMLNNFVSEIDQLLQKLEKEYPKPSLSQQKEIDKYRRIYFLRDVAERPDADNALWKEF